jgi:hypothetical protein
MEIEIIKLFHVSIISIFEIPFIFIKLLYIYNENLEIF